MFVAVVIPVFTDEAYFGLDEPYYLFGVFVSLAIGCLGAGLIANAYVGMQRFPLKPRKPKR